MHAIQDSTGVTQTTTCNINRSFTAFTLTKYDNIPTDVENISRLIGNTHHTLPTEANNAIDAPITMNELRSAVTKGNPNKAPGSDGIS
jgi:hypothetical protein